MKAGPTSVKRKKKRRVDWETPQGLFNFLNRIFNYVLDAAASSKNTKCDKYFDQEQDALFQNWKKVAKRGWIHCNPPYGYGIDKWVAKFTEEAKRGAKIVAIIPLSTDTLWNDHVFEGASCLLLPFGRIKFELDGKVHGTSMSPALIAIYGTVTPTQIKQLSQIGQVITGWVCRKDLHKRVSRGKYIWDVAA